MKKNKKTSYLLDGFSLVEMAMVLLIIGIIAGSVFKGKDIIESAQIRSVANDIDCIKIAYSNYINTYGVLPGDDGTAASKFPNTTNGDGDGKYSEDDANKVFTHLYAAGLIASPSFKTPKIGGSYTMISENQQLKIQISDGTNGIATAKQVILLKAKLAESYGNDTNLLQTTPELSNNNEKYIITISITS